MAQHEKERERLDYPELLRVIGHFIQQERLSDVSILEFEGGWIVHGLTYTSTSFGFIRLNADHVLSHDDVRKLQEQLKGQRKEQQQQKKRWL
ncbi:MAG: hypothetical protein H7Y32_07645 [Chloroflexales bacterium]|nr:hypothetical protein [Chloroflexales bacterium]